MSSGRRVSDAQLQWNISSSSKSIHKVLVNLCLAPAPPEVSLSVSEQPSIMISIVAVPILLLSDQLLDIR